MSTILPRPISARIDTLFDAVLSGADHSPLSNPAALYDEAWEIAREVARQPSFREWAANKAQHFSVFDFEGPRPALVKLPEPGELGEREFPLNRGGGWIGLDTLRYATMELGEAAYAMPEECGPTIDRLRFLLAAAAHRAGSMQFRQEEVETAISFHIPTRRSRAFRAFRQAVFRLRPRRLWVMSDIHLECDDWFPEARPEFDALVVAGDVKEDDPAGIIDWIARAADGRPAVFVPGNHDYCTGWHDVSIKADILKTLREQGDVRGVTVLDGDESDLMVSGLKTRFIGATLWTDWKLADLGVADSMSREDRLHWAYEARRQAQDSREGAVDYTRILTKAPMGGERGSRWSVADAVADHARMRLFIEEALVSDVDTAVVVTHHAPSPRSYGRKFDEKDFFPLWEPAFYASDLEDMIEVIGPDLWVHGHIHHKADYHVGETRIVSNPRGRESRKGELRSGFDPGFVVEL